VRRYSVAVSNARKIVEPPHPIDIELRRAAREWLRRFATKTDFARLMAVLGNPDDAIITLREQRDVVLAFFVHKTANGKFRS
jgi:hypothetical protein